MAKKYNYTEKTGRPTDYKPEILVQLDEYLRSATPENQQIPTVEGLALKLGITKKTLYNWADVHPEFLHSLEQLKMKQKEALIQTGIFGGKEVNASIIALLLKVNHDMIETTKSDITSGGKPLPTPILSALDVHFNNSPKEAEEAQQED